MGRVNLNGENVEPAGRFSLATKLAVLTPCGDAQEHAFAVVRIVSPFRSTFSAEPGNLQ